jgi:hypothetical protein
MTVHVRDSEAMIRWLTVALHLLAEAGAARRDAGIRFPKTQVDILRRKLGGNRVIPSPHDRAQLLATGRQTGLFKITFTRIIQRYLDILEQRSRTCAACPTVFEDGYQTLRETIAVLQSDNIVIHRR